MNEEKEDSEDFGFNIHYHKEDESEDIPFREYWKRVSVESMKKTLCDWIDHNVEHEFKTNPDIYSKENETRLYFKVHEKNVDGYFCVFEIFDIRKVEDTDVEF